MNNIIPKGPFCDNCPFYNLFLPKEPIPHIKQFCRFKNTCFKNCFLCTEPIAYCSLLKCYQYGQMGLCDMIKICDINL